MHPFVFLIHRPFVEFFSAPFWSVVSTRFRQAKNILLMALLSWIVFTVAIGLITPPPHSCWREMNATHQAIERVDLTKTTRQLSKRQIVSLPTIATPNLEKLKVVGETGKSKVISIGNSTTKSTTRRRKSTTTMRTTTRAMIDEDEDIDDDEEDDPINDQSPNKLKLNSKPSDTNNRLHVHTPQKTIGNPIEITLTNLSLVKPLASPVLYEQKDVRNVFMVFLLLIIIGEFFSAPAITLAVRHYLVLCLLSFDYLGCVYINTLRSRY